MLDTMLIHLWSVTATKADFRETNYHYNPTYPLQDYPAMGACQLESIC
jgi:hypothetical protein